jgi:outer membrane biosynthesis protein TonB
MFELNVGGLDALAGAINNLAAAMQATNALEKASTPPKKAKQEQALKEPEPAPKPEQPPEPPKQEPAVKVTIADVRAAIAALAKTDKERALKILESVGAKSVSLIKEEDYEKVLSAAK